MSLPIKTISWERCRTISLWIGVVGLVTSIPGVYFQATRFYQSYLFAYLFWSELTLGSMALLMIFYLTGGNWGKATSSILQASTRNITLIMFLFVPILFGLGRLYPWSDPAIMGLDSKLIHKRVYLNPTAFSFRALFYFLMWDLLSYYLIYRIYQRRDVLKKVSAGGLVFFGFSITFAAVDWQMSLEPDWYSTVYGVVFAVGQCLGAWAFTILVLAISMAISRAGSGAGSGSGSKRVEPDRKTLLDIGNILLTLVILWAYLSFMQYLIIWSGDLPEEVLWINHRMQHGWQGLAIVLILFQFFAPFSALLFRDVKSRLSWMSFLCLGILLIRILDRFWYIQPAFFPDGISVSWLDLSLLVGIGGLWLWSFFTKIIKEFPTLKETGDVR